MAYSTLLLKVCHRIWKKPCINKSHYQSSLPKESWFAEKELIYFFHKYYTLTISNWLSGLSAPPSSAPIFLVTTKRLELQFSSWVISFNSFTLTVAVTVSSPPMGRVSRMAGWPNQLGTNSWERVIEGTWMHVMVVEVVEAIFWLGLCQRNNLSCVRPLHLWTDFIGRFDVH